MNSPFLPDSRLLLALGKVGEFDFGSLETPLEITLSESRNLAKTFQLILWYIEHLIHHATNRSKETAVSQTDHYFFFRITE